MIEKCKICGIETEDNKHYWKGHKIKMADYFVQYHNRRDLLTNEPIPFKSQEQYLLTDFLDKNNLRDWLKKQGPYEASEYCKKLLLRRKEQKDLKYTMSQVELRSLPSFPNLNYLDGLFPDGYYKTCEDLGFINKFKKLDKEIICEIDVDDFIKIDTREQSFLRMPGKFEIATLNYGDYFLSDFDKSGRIVIERKSLPDLIGSVGRNYDRFDQEIARAEKDGAYVFVLVEEKINKSLNFSSLPYIKNVKATEEFIFFKMRQLIQKFTNLQFVFCNGRPHMISLIEKLLHRKGEFKKYDVQLLVDLGLV